MKIRHTILVITYNQQEYIGQCLNSILNQSEIPFEVVVCDDCSPDNTWAIVQNYAQQYPDIVKAHRNDVNLGVFQNVNKIKTLATGDFVNFVSGDDLLPQGALEAYSKFIIDNNLNCAQPFVITTDSLILTGNEQKIVSNNFVTSKYDYFESVALGCLWGWDTGLSIGLLNDMEPLNADIGYQADLLWHLDKYAKARKHFYINIPGYIYRANVGVTAATKLKQHLESKKNVHQIIRQKYKDRINSKIDSYLKFDVAWNEYQLNPNRNTYSKLISCYIQAGRFRHNNMYRNNWRILIPISFKVTAKKLLRK